MEAKKPDNEEDDDKEDDNDKEDDLLEKEKKEKEEKLQQRFIECLNSFNTNAINECLSYLEDLSYEVIEFVLIKTSGIQKPNWNYAKVILDDYVKKKINSLDKLKIEQENIKNKESPTNEKNYKIIDVSDMTDEEYAQKMRQRRTCNV